MLRIVFQLTFLGPDQTASSQTWVLMNILKISLLQQADLAFLYFTAQVKYMCHGSYK